MLRKINLLLIVCKYKFVLGYLVYDKLYGIIYNDIDFCFEILFFFFEEI